jgi:hypothetical protein
LFGVIGFGWCGLFWYDTPKRSDSDELTYSIGIHYGDIACGASSEWICIAQLRFALIEFFLCRCKSCVRLYFDCE